MLNQPADGYTISYITSTIHHIMGSGQVDKSLFDENDLEMLANLSGDFVVFSTYADSQFKTLAEAIEFAKVNPGKLRWGGAQSMGTHHYNALSVMNHTGTDINFIVYENASETVLGLLGKEIEIGSTTQGSVVPYLESGELKVLAQLTLERKEHLSDVPTIFEVGMGLENFDKYLISCKYLVINPEVPEEVKQAWDSIIYKVVNDPEWIEFNQRFNQLVDEYMNREEATNCFREGVKTSREIFGPLVN